VKFGTEREALGERARNLCIAKICPVIRTIVAASSVGLAAIYYLNHRSALHAASPLQHQNHFVGF